MRRIFALMFLAAMTCWCQQDKEKTVSEYSYDLNGRRVERGSVSEVRGPKSSATVEKALTVNGRMAPREAVEEKVLSDDANGRVVERVIRKYDQDGIAGPPERVRIEESRNPDGSSRSVTTVFRSDLNGNTQLAQREVAESQKTPEGGTVRTFVERPGLSGSMESVERRESVTRKTAAGSESETSVFKRDTGGKFYEAERQVTQSALQGGASVSNLQQYLAREGKLELEGQTVTTTAKQPGGSEVSVVDIYRVSEPGRAMAAGKLKLLEQDIVERSSGVETVSVRRGSPSDPGRLGEPRKLSERVCTGDCGKAQ